MKKKLFYSILILLGILCFLYIGNRIKRNTVRDQVIGTVEGSEDRENSADNNSEKEVQLQTENVFSIHPAKDKVEVENGFDVLRFDGDYGFDEFLSQGGASEDMEVASFLVDHVLQNVDLELIGSFFGCSTVYTSKEGGGYYFGRNFDWNACSALVLQSKPKDGYASISTVNTDFIRMGLGNMADILMKSDEILAKAAFYVPLDGMNEKGFVISVNMIQDSAVTNQDTDKPDLTTTTAIRLLLNQAATVEEAIAILSQYDMHSSMGMVFHFAMADATGRSVVVEYVNQEMKVIETPVVTNFYLAEGEKYGIGTSQSHERYDILMDFLEDNPFANQLQIRDALDSVSKDNFEEFASTEWSIVYDLEELTAIYYHRENYETGYQFTIK